MSSSTSNKKSSALSPLFPILDSVEKMRNAIALLHAHINAQPFYEKKDDKNQHSFFNYKFQSSYVFPDVNSTEDESLREAILLTRECRGLCFSLKSGVCVSRGFHKFFNVNEKPETMEQAIDLARDHVILDKVDGSMIVAQFVEQDPQNGSSGVIRFRSKMGWNTDTSKLCEKFIYGHNDSNLFPKFEQQPDGSLIQMGNEQLPTCVTFAAKWISKGYSAIFEYVSPVSKIVITYPEENIILLSLRHNLSGDYFPFAEMKKDAETIGLKVIRSWDSSQSECTTGLVKEISAMQNLEGFVLRFADGRMYKIKSSWYVELHHVKNKNAPFKESDLWRLIFEDKLDDILAKCETQDLKAIFEKFSMRLWQAIEQASIRITEKSLELRKKAPELKDYVLLVRQEQLTKIERALLFTFKSGIPSLDKIEDQLVALIVQRLPKPNPSGWGKIPGPIKEELAQLCGFKNKDDLDVMIEITPLIQPSLEEDC